jgi:hypothetical protein
MRFPILNEVEQYREMTTAFGGYNHRMSCQEGQFFDMKNMTSKYFPILSPRSKRAIIKTFQNPQGVLEKEDLWWIDNRILYRNGIQMILNGVELSDEAPKTMAKMGAYIIIMPDRVWVNTSNTESTSLECGYMEAKSEVDSFSLSTCKASGKVIEWHDAAYYEDEKNKVDGSYMMSTDTSGTPSLKVYSASTKIWMSVTSTYMQINSTGIGNGFSKEDGIKVSVTYPDGLPDTLKHIFINDEGGGVYSTNTYVVDVTENSITIPGIYKGSVDAITGINLKVERKVPDLAYITECGNRLWGCSKDGHEIYCCKLGDVKNWNCFMGISTDSWAATIGSDGKFTGAITFSGYPIFFKEDGLIKISISTTGAHAVKETKCRGVQYGSDRSLAILNEVLYYKSAGGICGYNGGLPSSVSDDLGDTKYYDAVSGVFGDNYYVSMKTAAGEYSLFVLDTKNGIWCKEDNTKALYFCKYYDDLYFIDGNDNKMKSIGGTFLHFFPESETEQRVNWYVESGAIGYSSPDYKYIGRINLRLTLEVGTNVDFFIQYDSCGEWKHIFNMSGNGTKSFSVPIIPQRCDHFKYRIVGNGNCKIHSITKTIEEGSEG